MQVNIPKLVDLVLAGKSPASVSLNDVIYYPTGEGVEYVSVFGVSLWEEVMYWVNEGKRTKDIIVEVYYGDKWFYKV